jgi:hypothetical protein
VRVGIPRLPQKPVLLGAQIITRISSQSGDINFYFLRFYII